MTNSRLKRKLSVEEAEAENLVADAYLGPVPIPFGWCNAEWVALLARMQPGDELWEFRSSDESWLHRAGRAGIALVRGDQVIATVLTRMN